MNVKLENDYIKKLRERGKTSRVYRKYQLTGLALSRILNDDTHKTLYITLAKQYNDSDLIVLAKRIAEKGEIRNKGAYFMKILAGSEFKKVKILPHLTKPKKKTVTQRTIFDVLKRKKKKS